MVPQKKQFHSIPRFLSAVTIGCVIAFIILVVILHIVRQDYDPVKRFISEYAVGPYGWIMQIASYMLSLTTLALAMGLWRKGFKSGRSQLGVISLGISSGGEIVAGSFPVDLQGTPLTLVGIVHLVASFITLISLFLAMAVFGRKFRKDPDWVGISSPSVTLAVLAPMSLIAITVCFVPLGIPGIGQWFLFLAITAWLCLVAIRLRKVSVAGWGSCHLGSRRRPCGLSSLMMG